MRSLLLLLLFCGLSLFLRAQEQARFTAGIHFYTGLTGEGTGYHNEQSASAFIWRTRNPLVPVVGGGGWADYMIGTNVHLIVGLQYTNSGTTDLEEIHTTGPAFGRPVPLYARGYRFRIHQLQLPITCHLYLGHGRVRPELFFGGQISHNWLGRIHTDSPYYIDEQGQSFSFSWSRRQQDVHYFVPLSVQIVFGVGVRLNPKMRLECRHAYHDRDQAILWSTQLTGNESEEEWHFFNTHSLWGGRTFTRFLEATTLQLSYRLY